MVEPLTIMDAGGEAEEMDLDGELATWLTTWFWLTIETVELSCICICWVKSVMLVLLVVL